MNQKCLYQVLSEEKPVNSNFTIWFNYVLNFIDECDSTENYRLNCSEKIMKDLNINIDKVQRCMKTFDTKLLREDREWATKLGIIIHPAVSINNITYRGDINGYDVFRAVCAGFSE